MATAPRKVTYKIDASVATSATLLVEESLVSRKQETPPRTFTSVVF
jgi:hypothetical protein